MRWAMTGVVLGAIAGTLPVRAQEPGLSAERLGSRAAPILLLTRGDVRADLALSPDQADAADAAIRELYRRAETLRGQSNGPQVIAARKAIDESERQWLAANLSPDQQARLAQIDLQWEGPAALATRGSVAVTLGLTAEQVRTLRTAVEQRRRGGPDAERHLAQATLALLTPAQRDRWRAMLGRPLAIQVAGGPASTPR